MDHFETINRSEKEIDIKIETERLSSHFAGHEFRNGFMNHVIPETGGKDGVCCATVCNMYLGHTILHMISYDHSFMVFSASVSIPSSISLVAT